MLPEFKDYWNKALAGVSRQLISATSTCKDPRLEVPISTIDLAEIAKGLKPPRLTVTIQDDEFGNAAEGHMIAEGREGLSDALEWLQQEVADLVKEMSNDANGADLKQINRVLDFSADDITHHFGTLTEGWDRLVTLKRRLLLPNRALLARMAWLVSIFADIERSFREAICLAVQCLGKVEPVHNAAVASLHDISLELSPKEVLHAKKGEDAVAGAFAKFMAGGLDRTLNVAEKFGQQLGVMDVANEPYEKGFHIEFEDLGENTKEIIQTLVHLRHAVLHDTGSITTNQSMDGTGTLDPPCADDLLTWEPDRFRAVAQMMYSGSIRYSLGVMEVVSRHLLKTPTLTDSIEVARYKAAAELHVASFELLKEELWWLAWSMADFVNERYEGKSRLMLQLNAAFARSKLGEQYFSPADVRAIDVKNAAPRYQIMRKCLLGEWEGMEELMHKALESRDMTLDEFNRWPALESLRGKEFFHDLIATFEKGQ